MVEDFEGLKAKWNWSTFLEMLSSYCKASQSIILKENK